MTVARAAQDCDVTQSAATKREMLGVCCCQHSLCRRATEISSKLKNAAWWSALVHNHQNFLKWVLRSHLDLQRWPVTLQARHANACTWSELQEQNHLRLHACKVWRQV